MDDQICLTKFVKVYAPHKDFTLSNICVVFLNLTNNDSINSDKCNILFTDFIEIYNKISNDKDYLKNQFKEKYLFDCEKKRCILAKEEFRRLNLFDCRPPCIQNSLIDDLSIKFKTPKDVNNLILPFIPPKIHHCEIMKILIKYGITKLKKRFNERNLYRWHENYANSIILREWREWTDLRKEKKGITKSFLKTLPLMPKLKSKTTKKEMIEIYDKIILQNGICILKNHPKFCIEICSFLDYNYGKWTNEYNLQNVELLS